MDYYNTYKCAIFIFLSFLSAGIATASDNPQNQPTNIGSLISESDRLVKQAISSQANATTFRIDVNFYRESLRELMIEAEKADQNDPNLQNIFMQLVRMSALLQSAAACKTGRYIVCPAELRQQLLSQQARLQQLNVGQS